MMSRSNSYPFAARSPLLLQVDLSGKWFNVSLNAFTEIVPFRFAWEPIVNSS